MSMRPLFAVVILVFAACIPPLDLFGTQALVTEEENSLGATEDDRIEDKQPQYDPARTVVETFGHPACTIRLNKSATVTKLDLTPLDPDLEALAGKVFRGRAEAIAAVSGKETATRSVLPSMEVVNGALKPFNDGLYAAIEMAVQEGDASHPGKRDFLTDLLARLVTLHDAAAPAHRASFARAAADVGAALILAGAQPALPPAMDAEARALVGTFESTRLASKPIGFYTWAPELERIFRQDRFLQNWLPPGVDPVGADEFGKAAALALALRSDEVLRTRYDTFVALSKGLTNPYYDFPVTSLLPYLDGSDSLDDLAGLAQRFLQDHPLPALDAPCLPHFAVFPASTSKETRYFETITCGDGGDVPDFMAALVAAIKRGEVDLTPGAQSGWYDFQSHALETLLLPDRSPESQHLLLTANYKKKLVDTFKSLLTQNRETHAKQLEIGARGESIAIEPVKIFPNFPVEPFPTFYLRNARAYRFLGTYLEAVLGAGRLDTVHRRIEDGTSSPLGLKEELRQKAELLYGLYFATADSVGLAPALLPEELAEFPEEASRARVKDWLAGWKTDADVLRDVRVIVPVQQTEAGTVYWAVTGVRLVQAHAEFVKGHEPRDVTPAEQSACYPGPFAPHDYLLMVENFAEIRLPADVPPPTRDEFRAACDAHASVEGITAALGVR